MSHEGAVDFLAGLSARFGMTILDMGGAIYAALKAPLFYIH
jgi:hypothetical protein